MRDIIKRIAAVIVVLSLGWIVAFVSTSKVNCSDPASIVVTAILSVSMYV